MFDVTVIGGGVIGGTILRKLTEFKLKVCLLEKENDVCMGQSKANSGIVHAGFDAAVGSLKAKFNVLGNKMMPEYSKELGVKYSNNGSLVVAFSNEEMGTVSELKKRGELNGVNGLEILNKIQLKELEPNISDKAVGALYAKTGGIICPYELTIAAIGNAMDNGADLFTDYNVTEIKKVNGIFTVLAEDGRYVESKILINCAGLGSEKIAELAGDNSVKIGARRGQYILLDRESGDFVSHTLFFTPTKLGKGILISQTVDKNIIIGPTAEAVTDGCTDTTLEGLATVIEKANQMCDNVPFQNTITSFAGVRAFCDRHDFIIEESSCAENLINCAGIESPGLTSAPAIAEYVVNEIIVNKLHPERNEKFNGVRKADYFFKNLSVKEKNALIKQNPSYGNIVCRCEQITEGEIIRAITENPPANNIDAVKRRTRAGMGRCQGGFCQPRVAELISLYRGIPFEKVTKSGGKSYLTEGKTK